jgi:hypothetical protein
MVMPSAPVRDIMRRTIANLVYVEQNARPDGPFEVTQLINSFLGALAHPWESLHAELKMLSLAEAAKRGRPAIAKEWPADRDPATLGDLMRLMRNSFAHGNIDFLPGAKGEIQALRVWNTKGKRRTWGTIVTVDDARAFLLRFAELAEEIHDSKCGRAPQTACLGSCLRLSTKALGVRLRMSSSFLFHIGSNGSLSEMMPQPYDNEDHIQRLLADYPAILGGQYRDQEPRRWALIQREVAVPDGAISDRRWSLDHLYVDQDAIPTLVEVKRSRDTRSRREVVGQMFDYAANGPAYWSISELRDAFAATHTNLSVDPAEALRIKLGEDIDGERFWSQMEDNLRSGRIRMIFLVDEMPPELLRIVEFLAKHLRTAEVYAVEVRQHVGASGQVLATSILGQLQNDEQKISVGRTKSTQSEDEWFSTFRKRHGDEMEVVARNIHTWARKQGLTSFVTTAQSPSLGWSANEKGTPRYPLFLTATGKIYTPLSYLAYSPKFAAETDRQAVVDAFRASGISFPLSSLNGDIRIPITALPEGQTMEGYLGVVESIVDRLSA